MDKRILLGEVSDLPGCRSDRTTRTPRRQPRQRPDNITAERDPGTTKTQHQFLRVRVRVLTSANCYDMYGTIRTAVVIFENTSTKIRRVESLSHAGTLCTERGPSELPLDRTIEPRPLHLARSCHLTWVRLSSAVVQPCGVVNST